MRHNKTVLLVENNSAIAASRKEILERYGWLVVTAASGEKAVEKVRSDPAIDLVLVNADPGNGSEGYRAVWTILSERGIPVLLYSGPARQGMMEKTKEGTSDGPAERDSVEDMFDASIRTALRLHGTGRNHGEPEALPPNGPEAGRDWYRVLVDGASDAIIVADVKGNFVEVNRRAARLLGYTKRELVGMTPLDIHPKEEHGRVVHHFAGIAAGQMNALYDTRVLTKKGDIIPVDITGAPVKVGERTLVQGIFRDITDRKRMEEELEMHRDHLENLVAERTARVRQEVVRRKEKEEQYLALVESVKEWIWETDVKFVHTYASSRVKDELGYSPGEVIGRSPFDFMPEKERIRAMPLVNDILSGRQPFVKFQTVCLHKRGHFVFIEVNGTPYFDRKGNFLGFRGSCRNVTEQKVMMDALKDREKELTVKSQSLQEMNAALKVLLKQREDDRRELEGRFVSNIKEMILPHVLKIQGRHQDPWTKTYLDIVLTNLNEIISPFLHTVRLLDFTPREIEVASLIKEGRTTKEIARILGVAPSAVESHRNNMRAKLGLINRKVNLRSYLLSLK